MNCCGDLWSYPHETNGGGNMKMKAWPILLLGLVIASGTAGCATTKGSEAVPTVDREEILDLIANYAYTYDARDLDGFLALLTDDCLWEAYAGSSDRPVVRVTSRSDLREVVLQPQADGSIAGTTMLV
jgi:hypothetical protein